MAGPAASRFGDASAMIEVARMWPYKAATTSCGAVGPVHPRPFRPVPPLRPLKPMHTTLTIPTHGPGLYEITGQLRDWAEGAGLREGVLHLMIRHTSASLLIQENADPEVRTDLTAFFHRLVPPADHPSMAYLTHTYEGPDDMPAHIKAALLPTCLTIPLIGGRLALGTWQGVYVVEHRRAPHHRQVVAMLG